MITLVMVTGAVTILITVVGTMIVDTVSWAVIAVVTVTGAGAGRPAGALDAGAWAHGYVGSRSRRLTVTSAFGHVGCRSRRLSSSPQ